jgi:glycosyltransferase involved in cell wall biosynthesis
MRTCLASIIDQEPYGEWEAIICDNSDRPDCIEKIQELAKVDSRIRYEHTGERAFDLRIGIRSLYTASEIGFKMSTGDWIVWPNCDSYYIPWFAQRMLKKAEEDDLQFVYSDLVHGRPDIMHYALNCQPWACACDKTNFIFKREWMPEEWPGKVTNYGMADGDLINLLVAKGIRHGKVSQLLVVHN